MQYDILALILRLALLALMALGGEYLAKVRAAAIAEAGLTETEEIERKVGTFVRAAEQIYRTGDPTGALRNKYVKEALGELGVRIDGYVDALIEAAVHALGHGGAKHGGTGKSAA